MATIASARVGVQAIRAAKAGGFGVGSLKQHHKGEKKLRAEQAKEVA